MSVNAHTNEYGNHFKFESWSGNYVKKAKDPRYAPYFDSSSTFERTECTAVSYKNYPVKSDGFNPTEYHRHVGKAIGGRGSITEIERFNNSEEIAWVSTSDFSIGSMLDLRDAPFELAGGLASNAESAAITSALNKLGGGKAALGVDLITAKQAVKGLAGASTSLVEGLLEFKRSGFKSIPFLQGLKPSELPSFARDKWLQFQYEAKPLYHQIGDYCGVLNNKLPKPMLMHGKSTKTWAGHGERTKFGVYQTGRSIGSFRSHTCAVMRNPYLASFNDVGLLNPLSIAWELVPYSFVVDWFVPVGDVLSGLSATAGLDFVWGYHSRSEDCVFNDQVVIPSGRRNNTESLGATVERTCLYYFYDRYVQAGFDLPELYGKANPFNTTKVANAISLISQLR